MQNSWGFEGRSAPLSTKLSTGSVGKVVFPMADISLSAVCNNISQEQTLSLRWSDGAARDPVIPLDCPLRCQFFFTVMSVRHLSGRKKILK
jgi:hypothetical protein